MVASLARYVPLQNNGYANEQQVGDQAAAVAEEQVATVSDKAAMDNAQARLSHTTITSPIDGVTILATLPSAGVGALLMLPAFGFGLDVIGIIGIILPIGIVKKNGIMLVDFALHTQRERHRSAEDPIHEACLLRFRPIQMTTMCALLGGLPLMLSNGTGSELRKPLGYAMVGGLVVSQALTLFTTPVVYICIYMDMLVGLMARLRGVRREVPAVAAAADWPDHPGTMNGFAAAS